METRNFNLKARNELLELSDMPNCRMGMHGNHGNGDMNGDATFRLTPEIHRTVEGIRFIYEHIKADDDDQTVREDWKYIAMVIDRLQLWVFLGVTIGGTVGILIDVPHIFDYVDQAKIVDEIQAMGNT
jgi:hypothetical protein